MAKFAYCFLSQYNFLGESNMKVEGSFLTLHLLKIAAFGSKRSLWWRWMRFLFQSCLNLFSILFASHRANTKTRQFFDEKIFRQISPSLSNINRQFVFLITCVTHHIRKKIEKSKVEFDGYYFHSCTNYYNILNVTLWGG